MSESPSSVQVPPTMSAPPPSAVSSPPVDTTTPPVDSTTTISSTTSSSSSQSVPSSEPSSLPPSSSTPSSTPPSIPPSIPPSTMSSPSPTPSEPPSSTISSSSTSSSESSSTSSSTSDSTSDTLPPSVTPSTTTTPEDSTSTPVTPTPPPSTTVQEPSSTYTPVSSTSTYVFSTVIISTDPNGHVQTQTVRSTQLIFPTQAQGGGGGSSSNTGAIAGGVVGGAVGILALILLVFFILRRRKRSEDFDGNFDPDRLDPERLGGNATRPGAMPNIDLVGAEVTPYQYLPDHSDAAQQKGGYAQHPQMAQRSSMTAPVLGAGGAGSGYGMSDIHSSTTGSHYPTTITDQSVTGMRNPDFRGPSPGVSLLTSGTIPSSKEREVASGFRVANDENGEGGSGQGSGTVVQHLDGGRVHQQTAPEEVPPSYDSISPDERSAAGTS